MLQRNFEPASKLMPRSQIYTFLSSPYFQRWTTAYDATKSALKYRVVGYGRNITITVSVAACGN
jgi:hypothetical protein